MDKKEIMDEFNKILFFDGFKFCLKYGNIKKPLSG